MTEHARKIAVAIKRAAKETAKYHMQSVVIGTVRKAGSDLRIQPMTGTIAIPDEALLWTTHGWGIKDQLTVGDQVLMVQVASQHYVVVGEISANDEGFAGGGGGDVTSEEFDAHVAETTTAHGGIVANTDPRLTDSRTPTAHATTHKNGGSDPIKLNELALPTAATPMNGQKFTGLGAGTTNGDSLRYEQVVGVYTLLSDPRLADARTPTAHASTHASGGSDPITIAESQVTNLTTDLAAKAPLASPTFTGVPSGPTATGGTNTTQFATTAFVQAAISALNLSGTYLTIAAAASTYAPINNPVFTGSVTVIDYSDPNQEFSAHAASTAFVNKASRLKPVSGIIDIAVNINSPGSGPWDGATPSSGQTWLATAQSTASENGPWVYNGSGVPMTRPTYWPTGSFQGLGMSFIPVFGNTASSIYTASSNVAIVGTSNVFFSPILGITLSTSDNSRAIATTAFVKNVLGSYLTTAAAAATYAPLASPAFTGTPTAPTPAPGDNSTKISTTAFVEGELGAYLTTASAAATYVTIGGSIQTITGAKIFSNSVTLSGPFNISSAGFSSAATLQSTSASGVQLDSTTASFTLNLPLSPNGGQIFLISDGAGQCGVHPVTIGRNGKTIAGRAADYIIDTAKGFVFLYYDLAGNDWKILEEFNSTTIQFHFVDGRGTSNVNIASPGAGSIGGITPAAGMRFFLDAQTTTAEKGIYLYNGSAVAMTREPDWASGTALKAGHLVYVKSGNSGGLIYSLSNAITVGTNAPTMTSAFAALAQANVFSASNTFSGGLFNTGLIGLTPGTITTTSTLSGSSGSAHYRMDSTAAAFTVNLPAAPAGGQLVILGDGSGACATNPITIGRNGNKIGGQTSDLVINVAYGAFALLWDNSSDWKILARPEFKSPIATSDDAQSFAYFMGML